MVKHLKVTQYGKALEKLPNMVKHLKVTQYGKKFEKLPNRVKHFKFISLQLNRKFPTSSYQDKPAVLEISKTKQI